MRILARAIIRAYQLLISPFLPPRCRFHPSCSHYAMACFGRFSFPRAMWYTLTRLSKCHPWHSGGYDPVPDADH